MGRLLEVRIGAGYRSSEDVAAIYSDVREALAPLPSSQRLVIVTDWRRCTVMGEGAAEQLVAAIRSINHRIERGGALLPVNSPTAMLQLQRLLRESNNPDRRGFTDPRNLISWLSEVLTPDEIARLHAFVA